MKDILQGTAESTACLPSWQGQQEGEDGPWQSCALPRPWQHPAGQDYSMPWGCTQLPAQHLLREEPRPHPAFPKGNSGSVAIKEPVLTEYTWQ